MKVIDLLNKIANGEEVPKKIKYDTKNYYFRNYDYKEYNIKNDYIDEQTSFIECIDFFKLNDNIEIIEEDKPIKEVKLPKKLLMHYNDNVEEEIMLNRARINMILDYLKAKEEREENE